MERGLILVADDDHRTYNLLSQLLDPRRYELVRSQGGAELLGKARARTPRLIFLATDSVPVGDLCDSIKHDKTLSGVPLVLLESASGPREMRTKSTARADFFLSKPLKLQTLAPALARLIPESTDDGPLPFASGNGDALTDALADETVELDAADLEVSATVQESTNPELELAKASLPPPSPTRAAPVGPGPAPSDEIEEGGALQAFLKELDNSQALYKQKIERLQAELAEARRDVRRLTEERQRAFDAAEAAHIEKNAVMERLGEEIVDREKTAKTLERLLRGAVEERTALEADVKAGIDRTAGLKDELRQAQEDGAAGVEAVRDEYQKTLEQQFEDAEAERELMEQRIKEALAEAESERELMEQRLREAESLAEQARAEARDAGSELVTLRSGSEQRSQSEAALLQELEQVRAALEVVIGERDQARGDVASAEQATMRAVEQAEVAERHATESQDELLRLRAEVQSTQVRECEAQDEIERLTGELVAARAGADELLREREDTRVELAAVQQRVSELRTRAALLDSTEEALAETQQAVARTEASLAEAQQRVDVLEQEAQAAAEQRALAEQALDSARQEADSARNQTSQAQDEIKRLEGELDELQAGTTALHHRISELLPLQEALEAARRVSAGLDARLVTATTELRAAQEAREEAERGRQELASTLVEARRQLEGALERVSAAEARASDLEQEREILAAALEEARSAAAATDTVAAELEETRRALEHAAAAEAGALAAQEQLEGLVTERAQRILALEGRGRELEADLTATAEELSAAREELLLVTSESAAADWLSALLAAAKEQEQVLLARIDDLEGQIAELLQRLVETEAARSTAGDEGSQLRDAMDRARRDLSDREQALTAAREALAGLRAERDEASEARDGADHEVLTLRDELEQARREGSQRARTQVEAAEVEARRATEELARERGALAARVAELEADLRHATERLSAAESGVGVGEEPTVTEHMAVEVTLDETEERLARVQAEVNQVKRERDSLGQQVRALKLSLEEARSRIGDLENALREAARVSRPSPSEVQQLERLRRELRTTTDSVRRCVLELDYGRQRVDSGRKELARGREGMNQLATSWRELEVLLRELATDTALRPALARIANVLKDIRGQIRESRGVLEHSENLVRSQDDLVSTLYKVLTQTSD